MYRAVDSQGNTLDFFLSAKRDARAAKRFFRKTLKALHTQTPRVITVDKNPAYPKAIKELKAAKELPGLGIQLPITTNVNKARHSCSECLVLSPSSVGYPFKYFENLNFRHLFNLFLT